MSLSSDTKIYWDNKMSKKRDFSNIGNNILKNNDKPSSLSDLIGVNHNDKNEEILNSGIKKENSEPQATQNLNYIIRECISISKSDADMVNDLAVKCASEGQKTTKADVYRASIRHFSKLSPAVMASKIREIRKDKKTHN